jgi:two-component sensor histidine kinase
MTVKLARERHAARSHAISEAERRTLDAMTGRLPTSVFYRLLTAPYPREDRGWSVVYASPMLEPLFGVTPEAAIEDASRWYGLTHPEDQERAFAAQAESEAKLIAFEETLRFVRPDGETRFFGFSAVPERMEDGCVVWNGVATDVTEMQRVSEERERLIGLVEATPDLVTITTRDGIVEYANAAALALRTKVKKPIGELTIADIHPPETLRRIQEEARPAIDREGVWRGEGEIVLHDCDLPIGMTIIGSRERGRVTRYAAIVRDLTEERRAAAALKEANDQAALTLREAAHRMKNFFSLVPALVSLSARTAMDKDELAVAIRERIGALSRSHTLTLHAFTPDEGVNLRKLIEAVIEPYQGAADAFELEGQDASLSGRTGNAVALTLHELATNAAKHGVLSSKGGSVRISWECGGGKPALRLHWHEEGGPPVEGPPARQGFGTSLLDRLVEAQGGAITRDWRREGLCVVIELPKL